LISYCITVCKIFIPLKIYTREARISIFAALYSEKVFRHTLKHTEEVQTFKGFNSLETFNILNRALKRILNIRVDKKPIFTEINVITSLN
jgi:hypothetical protein